MSSPISVCFLIDRLYRGGTELFLQRLITSIDRGRFAPSLVLLDHEAAPLPLPIPPDCPVLRLGVDHVRQARFAVAVWRLGSFLRRRRVDVLQLHHSLPTAVGLAAAALAPRARLVRTRFNLGYWLTPRGRRVERLAAERCDLTVVNCAAARDALLAEAPAPRGGIVVAANGIEMAALLESPPPEESSPLDSRPSRVGLLANLRPVKDPERFVEAAAALARRWPRARFEIAGDGELSESLERRAAELGIADRLTLRGEVEDVAGFLRDLDVAVLCSRSEALPNALLEYMAAARPIVATAVGGVPEVVRDGSEALLVPTGDTARLADAIDRLLADRVMARRLALAARQRALERYSMRASTSAYCTLWSVLVSRAEQPLRRLRGQAAIAQNETLLRELGASEVVGVPDLDRAAGDRGPVEG